MESISRGRSPNGIPSPWKTMNKAGGSMRFVTRHSDFLQAGRIYSVDKHQDDGVIHRVEVLEIRRNPNYGYGWQIICDVGNGAYIETFSMQQAMDCTWKEERKSEQRNREKGRGIFLDVRAMPQGSSRSDLLLYEEWKKKEDLRVMPERDLAGDGAGAGQPAA